MSEVVNYLVPCTVSKPVKEAFMIEVVLELGRRVGTKTRMRRWEWVSQAGLDYGGYNRGSCPRKWTRTGLRAARWKSADVSQSELHWRKRGAAERHVEESQSACVQVWQWVGRQVGKEGGTSRWCEGSIKSGQHCQTFHYLSDVFKRKLSPCQAGWANRGLAYGQPGRPGDLLSSPGQLGRLPSFNADPVETMPGRVRHLQSGQGWSTLLPFLDRLPLMFSVARSLISRSFYSWFCFTNMSKEYQVYWITYRIFKKYAVIRSSDLVVRNLRILTLSLSTYL